MSLIVPPEDTDLANRLRLSTLFDYMQSAASSDGEQLHVGYRDLSAAGLFWVLSWVKIQVDDYPRLQETITVTTWAQGRHRIFALRDFLFSRGQERPFARARTAWLVIDSGTRRIANLDRLPAPIPPATDRSALKALPGKMPPTPDAEAIYERQIRYSDLDLNRHVNTSKYVDFLLDCYPQQFHLSHQVRSLEISFQSESRFGDRLILTQKIDRERADMHHVVGRRTDEAGERITFQAIVDWGP